MWILEILLGLIVAIAFYNLIHHFLVKLPNHKRQLTVKHKIDRIVPMIMDSLKGDHLIPKKKKYLITSKLLSKIWGRDIFAYEFVLNLHFKDDSKLIRFKHYFNDTLLSYCRQHKITTKSGMSLYIVADIWEYRRMTHLDIACIYNSATIDYLKDIHRL
ncbi:hypothetical protein [Acetilactobacillus jinshanensis]|uniref:Uncharacterized protein n=1 Tax=Acetilactobacillus jinshanensis TaxID=1720083 RepID=A0A4P6ZJR4_9LACO|nr:hypothetical protein [Acetilactobacillus jinshanensis]QBP17916.1 hypothetical protein ELX58_01855 [Acetilactobacillus jinshanensis]URL60779.1 hypothetical protein HGK75_01890 [uncultured bacterium]